uniref:ADAM metallopeptidase domain 18 n=1 Tax=Molossus molossus TaxID=27622 RepID=A0A7J8GJ06_MOLMO|nr:hypothetical protein HJG59_000304 [Molossus molossus]
MLPLLLILLGVGQLTSLNHFKWGKLQHRRAARHSIYGKDSETSQLQITVPRKLETNNNDADVSEMHVTYAIQINRKTYTLFLEKQSFVDPHFLIYSYNRSGTVYPDSSFIKGHCFYQGYAMETPKSAVTLSICSGLRGLLQLENVSYGIEPLESAATYEHMLYQIKNNKADFPPLQESYPMIQLGDQPYKILVKSQTKPDVEQLRKTLKIQIIMDKALYEYMGSEVAVAAEKVVYIIGVINTMFSQLKVTIMLTYLELWSDQNKILSSGDANEILQRFVSWKKNFLSHRSHDLAFLLIYRDYPNYVGATYHGMACDAKLGAGIALACFRGSCQPISANKNYTTCNSTRHCNGHGVCNDEDVCHCDPGYAPPHCKATPSSPGGSLYDGFWYWDSKKKAAVMPTKKLHVASGKNGLLISFCIFLTFLLLIAIIALKWNKIKFWKRETVNEGSMSEGNSNKQVVHKVQAVTK